MVAVSSDNSKVLVIMNGREVVVVVPHLTYRRVVSFNNKVVVTSSTNREIVVTSTKIEVVSSNNTEVVNTER